MVQLRKSSEIYKSNFLEKITVDEIGQDEMGIDKIEEVEMGSR